MASAVKGGSPGVARAAPTTASIISSRFFIANRCRAAALAWIGHAYDDADLAADTRVSVPIHVDPQRRVTRLWETLGVRLVKIRIGYSRHWPMVRGPGTDGSWRRATDARVMGEEAM